ncbi:hypothetical protein [Zavarzinia compransoris]|uniref:DUF1127 domain-containing protein n=1 Tax=Zavarzinia compransoris TaxID=1264899 RepID=A0A317DW45_9PROT|nr:hypothetical protein [Zavarzinia compransoris]PWR18918.1 hypothetical protein DKG75_18265 [Zavarzinia compransoris]TDP48914.1 hypothetical protein DES42_101274 [Zavarzinia compransoris]
MSTVYTATPRRPASLLARLVQRMIEAHAEQRARRVARQELVRLAATSSHLIADIGLTPANDAGPRRVAPIVGW